MTIVESHNRILDAALFECDPQRRRELAHLRTDVLLAITEPFWKYFCPSQLPKEDPAINLTPTVVELSGSSGINKR